MKTVMLTCELHFSIICRMLIAVANSKGGVGKSTLAVHLAAWLDEQGHSVVLAHCDAQHSSSEWLKEAKPGANYWPRT